MAEQTVAISVKGQWASVPCLEVNGKKIIVRGKRMRLAVVHDEQWLESELENPELCIKMLKNQGPQGLRADIFTFAQMLPATQPKYRYHMEWESLATVRTSSFKEWWESLPQEARKNVRRAQKRGVVITVKKFDDDLIRGIARVNNESPFRQGVPNYHYGKSLDQVRIDLCPLVDRSDFICAYFEDELIGFIKLVYRGQSASILHLAAMACHNDKRPANALLAKAVELCEAKGMTHLVYGKFNYGNKRESPLRQFKERNGFEEVLVPKFYVPLTTRGKLYIKMGLHRGLLGTLPLGVITLALGARTRWYNFKRPLSRCSSMPERPNRTRQTERSNPPAGSNA